MANRWYNRALKEVFNQNATPTLDLITGSVLKVMLVGSGYTFNPDDDFVSSGAGTPGGEEVSGTGYVGGFGGSGRLALATKTITEDDANDRSPFDALDVTWTAPNPNGFTAAAAIVIEERTNDADSLLVMFIDTATPGFPVVMNGTAFTIQWNTLGISVLTSPG